MKNKIYLIFYIILFSLIFVRAQATAQANFPPGEVYFSPDTKIEDKFIGFLYRAQGDILFCARDFDSEKIADALIDLRTKRMLPVRIIIYKPSVSATKFAEKFLTYGINVVLAENTAGFDFNFCVIDFNSVYFSSADFTYKALNQDYNYSMIVSNSEKFADNFYRKFIDMYEGHYFGQAATASTPNPNLSINGATLDTAFLPKDSSDNRISSLISRASSKIRVLAGELKNSLILDNILGRKNDVSDISAIFEYGDGSASKQEYETLRRAGIYAVYNKGYTKLSIPVIIIDNQYVLFLGAGKLKDNSSTADSFFICIKASSVAGLFNNFFDAVMQKNTADITLTGQVRNASNSLALDATRVWFQSLSHEAYTDYLGWYELKGTLPDEFLVTAEREYYFSKDIIFLKKNGRRLDFLLNHIISYNSLSGFIIDKYSRSPIKGCGLVAVYIENGTGTRTFIRTYTNEKGFFSYPAIPVGDVDLEVSHPNYQKYAIKSFEVASGGSISLNEPIVLQPSYIITAYPNPVFEENILINVKDSTVGGEVPSVTIKQNNYIDIPVSMRIAASADLYNIYVGNYIMKKGYYGPARININGGVSYKDVDIDFLQAYQKYTYASPRLGFNLALSETAVKRPGYISITQDAAENFSGPEELASVSNSGPLRFDYGKNLSIAAGSGAVIEMTSSFGEYSDSLHSARGAKPMIYKFDDGLSRWKPLETEAYYPLGASQRSCEVKLKSSFDGPGKYMVLIDRKPPEILETRINSRGDATLKIKDEGSGLLESSLAVSVNRDVNSSAASVKFNGFEDNSRVASYTVSGFGDLKECGGSFALRDMSGNVSSAELKSLKYMAAQRADVKIEVFPNPCKTYAKFRIKNASNDSVSISFYDVAGEKLGDICNDYFLASDNVEVLFNLNQLEKYAPALNGLANSTLIYRVKFASGALNNGKLAIVK